MPRQPLFTVLVFDESGNQAESTRVGDEPCYLVDDAGFRRHISSEQVDRQVLGQIAELMKGSEDLLSEQAAKMLGQEDVFTVAAIQQQLKNMDKQFDQLLLVGLPEDMRAYLGMMGFRIIIDVHGEVLKVEQPGAAGSDGGEE
jgi:hypothetical protein